MSQNTEDLDPAQPLPDDYEFGRERLDQILEQFLGAPLGADENLLADIRQRAARWQLPSPRWTRREPGWYELNTPRGR